jgi:hypothetical protein
MDSQSTERSATDERIDANREPAPIAPATRDSNQTEPSGLPPGITDDDRSPLDPVFYDPNVRATST